jgi:hypothetical protein
MGEGVGVASGHALNPIGNMMNNLVWNFSQNYGVLIIAGITFCIVEALSYLFRRYVKMRI